VTSIHERYAETGTVLLCRDNPDSGPKRDAGTAEHFAYIEAHLEEIYVAGPLFDASGERVVGSLFCYRTKDAARARELLEGDPYYKIGVYASIEVLPFLPAAGRYIGGKIW
jgi:uncharacterized protein YciI